MFYQSLLTPYKSYIADIIRIGNYPSHYHSEIELIYIVEGELLIHSNSKTFCLQSGDLYIATCRMPHEINANQNCLVLLIEFGYSLLGNIYDHFNNRELLTPYFDSNNINKELFKHLSSILRIRKRSSISISEECTIQSDIFAIASIIYDTSFESNINTKACIDAMYPALEYIYNNYQKQLILSDISSVVGYSDAYFCRQFKSIIGTTVHNYLNYYRVSIACNHLAQTNLSINEIAHKTGFQSSIQFCRVFKNYLEMTPGEYRNLDPLYRPSVKPL